MRRKEENKREMEEKEKRKAGERRERREQIWGVREEERVGCEGETGSV